MKNITNELRDYLDNFGFDESNYGSESDPCIFYHHKKCEDILKIINGAIVVYSLPIEIRVESLGLQKDSRGNYIITSKRDVDTLVESLSLIRN